MYKANDDKIILEKLNKELSEKTNNFEADLDEKLRAIQYELMGYRNKITELEANLEIKDETNKNLVEQMEGNEDLIAKLKDEIKSINENKNIKEEEPFEKKEPDELKKEGELKEEGELEEPKIINEDYILKSIHEEMLEEKQNEINTLINTVNVVKRDKEDLEMKIANMKSSVQEITDRLEVEMDKHSNNNDEKNEMIQR